MTFSLTSIVGLSFAIALGVLFSILVRNHSTLPFSSNLICALQACTVTTDEVVGANWYPLVIVFTYAMAPVPVVLLGKSSTPPMWQHWAWFTTGWIAVSSFGIAVVASRDILCYLAIFCVI
jgi:hypothetical protein